MVTQFTKLATRWKSQRIVQRANYIVDHCTNKRVLHLGCSDHPFTEERMGTKYFLHDKIMSCAKEVVGLDLSQQGVDLMIQRGYTNIYLGNVEASDLDLGKFDIVVAGEIIEHLSNPGLFLDSIKKFMVENESYLLVTTVNSYCLFRTIFQILHMGKEFVHPDHVYYFSESTLKSLLQRYDYEISEFVYYPIGEEHLGHPDIPLYFKLANYFSKKLLPFTGDGVIALSSYKSRNNQPAGRTTL